MNVNTNVTNVIDPNTDANANTTNVVVPKGNLITANSAEVVISDLKLSPIDPVSSSADIQKKDII